MSRPYGYAINLGGTDEHSLGSNAVSLQFERTNTYTLQGWVKPAGATGTQIICGKMSGPGSHAGYDISMRGTTGRWQANLNNNVAGGNFINISSQTVITDGKWHHLALCYGGGSNAASFDMYTDGVLEAKNVHTDNLTASVLTSASFMLGARSDPPLVFLYIGMMSKIAVHNIKLNATQVQECMTRGIGPNLGCVEYLLCGSYATFPTIPDASINNTVGTLTNCEAGDIALITESAPVVSGYVPAVGTAIKPTQAVQFDVTDDYGLAAVLVHVTYGSELATDLIHDSTRFHFPYFGTRIAIAGGYRYTVQKTGGWPAAPTFVAHAIDQTGQANA